MWLAVPLVGLGLVMPAAAQDSGSPSPAHSYTYREWTAANGLLQSAIRRLAESSDGYLWLASRAGLIRFDGLRFAEFSVAQLPLLASNEARLVAGAREGGVWVGAAGGVLFRTDGPRVLEVLPQRDGVADDRRMAVGPNGDLWIVHPGGLDRLAGGRWTRFGREAGLRGEPWAVAVDSEGTAWAGTSDGLFVLKEHAFEPVRQQGSAAVAPVRSLLGDRHGRLWVGGSGELSVRRPNGTFERAPGVSAFSGPVVALAEGPDSAVWAVNGTSLCAWRNRGDAGHEDWTTTCYDVRLQPALPTDLLVTREGVVVVATNADGLRMLVPRPFRMVTAADGLSDTRVHHLAEARDGAVWIAAGCGGLTRMSREGRLEAVPTSELGLRQPCLQSLMAEPDGALWAGQQQGFLTRIAPDRLFKTWSTADGLPSADIGPLADDGRGGVWIGSSAGVVCRVERGTLRCPATPALPAEPISSMAVDRKGRLWVGQVGRISRIADGQVHTLTAQDGVPAGPIRVLKIDGDGTLWIGSYGGGLARLRDGRIARLTTQQGLFDNNISAVLADESGRVWLLGNKGVLIVSRSHLDQVVDTGGPSVEDWWFGPDDDLPEGNGGHPVGLLTRDGRVLFGTVNGMAVFDSRSLPARAPPSVVVEGVLDQGVALVARGDLSIQPGGGPVDFQFAVPTIVAARKVQVRTQLVGRDPQWIDSGLHRRRVYTGLAPGRYAFHVSVRSSDGKWIEPADPVILHVFPAWWQTWWARALGLGVGVLSLGWLVRSRLAAVDRRNRKLAREIAERQRAEDEAQRHLIALAHMNRLATAGELTASLAHELGQPLTAIVANAEASRMMLSSPKPDGDEIREILGEIALQGRRASEILRGLRAFLRRGGSQEAVLDLNAEVRDVIPLAWRELERAQVTLVVDLVQGPLWVRGDRIPLQQVVLNLMTNAADAMAPTEPGLRRLTVRSRRVGQTARVSVCDTGPGVDPDRVARIFEPFYSTKPQGMGLGLSICRSIVEGHRGQIRARNVPGAGAAFSFWIPVVEAPPSPEDTAGSHERPIP